MSLPKKTSTSLPKFPTTLKKQQKLFNNRLDAMYQYPAKKRWALIHRNATKFGYKSKINKDTLKCPCCNNPIATKQIPLCYSIQPKKPEARNKFYLLTAGVSIYFKFIQIVIQFLLLRFLIVDLWISYLSLYGEYCSNLKINRSLDLCQNNISGYNLKSLANQSELQIIDIANLIFTLVSMLFFYKYRKYIQKNYSWLDNCTSVTQQNFSILIQGIPLPQQILPSENIHEKDMNIPNYTDQIMDKIDDKIQSWLGNKKQQQKHIQQDKLNTEQKDNLDAHLEDLRNILLQEKKQDQLDEYSCVMSTTPCYDSNNYENEQRMREHLIECIISNKNNLAENDQQVKGIISKINHKLINICQKNAVSTNNFLGKMFITFSYQPFRSYFLRQYRKDNNFFKIYKSSIKMSPANRPQDIQWANLKLQTKQRNQNIIHSVAILTMQLIVSFSVILGLQLWQQSIAKNTTQVDLKKVFTLSNLITVLISSIMAISTKVVNSLLSYTINILANMERPISKTHKTGSLIIKTIVTQTINTMLVYFIVAMFQSKNVIGRSGLVDKILNLIKVSGALSIGLGIIPFDRIVDYVIDQYFSPKRQKYFQIQLNKKYELPQYNFTQQFSYYIVFTFTVLFYGMILPQGSFLLIFFFSVQYWVDKYNLFRRSSNVVTIDFFTIKASYGFLQSSLLISIIGHIIWDLKIHYESKFIYVFMNFANFALVIVYLTISYIKDYQKEQDWSQQNCINKNQYAQYQNLQIHNYDELNPAIAFAADKQRISLYKKLQLKFTQQKFQYFDLISLYNNIQLKVPQQKIEHQDFNVLKNDSQEQSLNEWHDWLIQKNEEIRCQKYNRKDVLLYQFCFNQKQINVEKQILYHHQLQNDTKQLQTISNLDEQKLKAQIQLYEQKIGSSPIEANKSSNCSRLAKLYSKLNQKERAIQYFKRALDIDPDDIITRKYLGLAYKEEKQYQQAQEMFNILINSYKNKYFVYRTLGQICKEAKWYDKAKEHFQDAYNEINDKYFDDYIYFAKMFSDVSSDKAYECMDQAKKQIQNNSSSSYHNLAYTYYYSLKDNNLAIYYYKQAISADPNNESPQQYLRILYQQTNMIKQGIEYFKYLIAKYPANQIINHQLRKICQFSDQTLQAIQCYKRIFKEKIQDEDQYKNIVQYYMKSKHKTVLQEFFWSFYKLQNGAIFYVYLSNIFKDYKELTIAKYYLKKAIELQPQNQIAQNKLKQINQLENRQSKKM